MILHRVDQILAKAVCKRVTGRSLPPAKLIWHCCEAKRESYLQGTIACDYLLAAEEFLPVSEDTPDRRRWSNHCKFHGRQFHCSMLGLMRFKNDQIVPLHIKFFWRRDAYVIRERESSIYFASGDGVTAFCWYV